MDKIFIGIDPGKKGALAVIDIGMNVLETSVTPLVGDDYDISKMLKILAKYKGKEVFVCLENVHAIQGKAGGSSNFQFGRGKGLWEMAILGLKFTTLYIEPKEWQKISWEGVTQQKIYTGKTLKSGKPQEKIDTKNTSLVAVKRLFPGETLLATNRSRVPHDGIVDALLIANACKQKFK